MKLFLLSMFILITTEVASAQTQPVTICQAFQQQQPQPLYVKIEWGPQQTVKTQLALVHLWTPSGTQMYKTVFTHRSISTRCGSHDTSFAEIAPGLTIGYSGGRELCGPPQDSWELTQGTAPGPVQNFKLKCKLVK